MIKYSLEELNPSDIAIYRILIGALFINIFVRAKENIVKADHLKIFIISFFGWHFLFICSALLNKQ